MDEDADARFDAAVRAAEAWGRDDGSVTGMWLDRRHLSIGVGIRTRVVASGLRERAARRHATNPR